VRVDHGDEVSQERTKTVEVDYLSLRSYNLMREDLLAVVFVGVGVFASVERLAVNDSRQNAGIKEILNLRGVAPGPNGVGTAYRFLIT
jgi:hypothetical protein